MEDDAGHICSHVQVRGSIPGYWKQDVSVAVPRPPIQVVKNDPLYRTFQEALCAAVATVLGAHPGAGPGEGEGEAPARVHRVRAAA